MVDRRDAARQLAKDHFAVEDGMISIYRLEGASESDNDPIKLLEVNADSVTVDRLMPLGFHASPARGIPYPYILMEVSPEEFRKIQAGEWKLPHDWRIAEEIVRN